MAKIPIPSFIIKHRGFFDYGELMSGIKDWLDSYDYYANIIYKQSGGGALGKNFFVDITSSRPVSEYVQFHIHMFVKLDRIRDVELIREGKKIKTNEGLVHIDILPELELDWQNRFGKKKPKFIQALGDFIRKYILKYKIADYWASMIVEEMTGFSTAIKNILGHEV